MQAISSRIYCRMKNNKTVDNSINQSILFHMDNFRPTREQEIMSFIKDRYWAIYVEAAKVVDGEEIMVNVAKIRANYNDFEVVRDLMLSAHKVTAIKFIKNKYVLGLKQAKDACEAILTEHCSLND